MNIGFEIRFAASWHLFVRGREEPRRVSSLPRTSPAVSVDMVSTVAQALGSHLKLDQD